jgi:serine/threonine protein kinase
MSAVREVKYLRELHHPNIIEVRTSVHKRPRRPTHSASCLLSSVCARALYGSSCLFEAFGRVLFEDESEPCPRVPRHRPRDDHQGSFAGLSSRGHQELGGHDVPRSRILSPKFHPSPSAYSWLQYFLPATASASHVSNLNHILFYLNFFLHTSPIGRTDPPYRCFEQLEQEQDLKPNNLLIASDGLLKIADFGLARDAADPGYKMTCQVITRYGHFDSLRLHGPYPPSVYKRNNFMGPLLFLVFFCFLPGFVRTAIC